MKIPSLKKIEKQKSIGAVPTESANLNTIAMKIYRTKENIGNSRYTVSFHDGISQYGDGSPFFDMKVFRSNKKKNSFIKELRLKGYSEIT